ncbi:MAG: hypothetical protein K2H18_07815 [Muribaculaceae bacterium]|nr:hypothetical protein [Muribaculaceae bacterium]
MNKLILFAFFLLSIFAIECKAQTTFWNYEYTISPEGAKFTTDYARGYKTMTFSDNANFVALTNSNGVSSTNDGYRYSYSENGFDVYTPSNAGGNASVNNLSKSLSNGALDNIFGCHPIGVSFNKGWKIMLVNLSNGNNWVFKRASNPSKPNINY